MSRLRVVAAFAVVLAASAAVPVLAAESSESVAAPAPRAPADFDPSKLPGPEENPGRQLFLITRFAGVGGDSGAPVWSLGFRDRSAC